MGLLRKIREAVGLPSEQDKFDRGEEIWNDFNKSLPEVKYITSEDEARLKLFRQMAERLSKYELNCLRVFLEKSYLKAENDYPEIVVGGSEMTFFSNRIYLFKEHLSMLPHTDSEYDCF